MFKIDKYLPYHLRIERGYVPEVVYPFRFSDKDRTTSGKWGGTFIIKIGPVLKPDDSEFYFNQLTFKFLKVIYEDNTEDINKLDLNNPNLLTLTDYNIDESSDESSDEEDNDDSEVSIYDYTTDDSEDEDTNEDSNESSNKKEDNKDDVLDKLESDITNLFV